MRGTGLVLVVVAAWPLASSAGEHEPGGDLPPPSAELLAPSARSSREPSLHPRIVLRDAAGAPVGESGGPASAAKTCDGCHDVPWIRAHDAHGVLKEEEGRRGPEVLPAGNCFLCHVGTADNRARGEAISQGRLDWVETATLAATGLVAPDDAGWTWQQQAFAPDGSVTAATLALGRPGDRACGFCHGLVYQDPDPLLFERDARQRMTDREGVVFSGQRISDSAMNLADKDSLTRPWDVHAERMVSCASCHFSPNHPAYAFADRGLDHLQFDARRLAITEYLRRPDHRLATGPHGTGANLQDGNLRRCEGCHDAAKAHDWLPRQGRHFAALLCESCHVPKGHAAARQETDWTVLTTNRQPRVVYRGVRDDGYLPGYHPVLLPRPERGGSKLGPNNLLTTYRWVERTGGKTRPVARPLLERAFFVGETHRPELVRALDRNADGKLQDDELVLDSEGKVKAVRELLVGAGAVSPEIVGEVEAEELHHGVSPGRFATRECTECHAADSRLHQPFVLASMVPFGVVPSFRGGAVPGAIARDGSGRLVLTPATPGLHVFGYARSALLDGLGILMFVGALLGAGLHALLRIRAARRRGKEPS